MTDGRSGELPADALSSTPDPLQSLADEQGVASGIVDAKVIEKYEDIAEITVTRTLNVKETRAEEWVPASTYERRSDSDTPFETRYDAAPSDISEERVTFLEMGQSAETCPKCDGTERHVCSKCDGTERHVCSKCGGDEEVDCSSCDGKGRNTCSECGGDYKSECSECDGIGDEDCDDCGGSGTRVERNATRCTLCGGGTTTPCPDCSGTDDECDRCDGEGVIECPDCGGTGKEDRRYDCENCSGTGDQDCHNCGGLGYFKCSHCTRGKQECTNCQGDGQVTCGNCGGNGNVTCTNCGGDGDVVCTQCDGDGTAVQAITGYLEFTTELETAYDAGPVPTDWITEEHSTLVDCQRDDPEERAGIYLREVRRYETPVKYVKYAYANRNYEVAHVGDTLKYTDYPRPPERLKEQIELARDNDTFALDTGRPLSESLWAAPKQLASNLVDIGVGVVLSVVAFVVVAFVTTTLPLPSMVVDLFTYSGTAAVIMAYGRWRIPGNKEITTAANGGGLLAPLVIGAAAAVAVIGAILSQPAQLLLATAASTLWAVRVAQRLAFEGERHIHRSRQRDRFLEYDLDGRLTELRSHGLEELLPPDDPSPESDQLFTARSAVFVIGWGLSVTYLGILLLSLPFDPFLLFDTINFTQALAIPAVLALACSVPLVLLRR